MADWGQQFFDNFAGELRRDGYSAEQSLRFLWQPTPIEKLNILGPERDQDLSKLATNADAVHAALKRLDGQQPAPVNDDFYQNQKTVLVLLPGYTHETLKNISWHDTLQAKQLNHHVVMLKPGADQQSDEEVLHDGSGLKIAYAYYPRSNAASSIIGPGLFELLHNSPSLRRWTSEGYKLVFVGYSNGSPLSLELLADLNSGVYADEFLLKSTAGFMGLCGDIGGAYLADDLLSENPKLVNFPKVLAFAKRHPLFAKLAGLGTEQLQDDAMDGIASVGRKVRQARMLDYAPKLPAHVKYFSVAAVMPMDDYRRRLWHFNIDDWSMYLQARVTQPITLYNDGQVALPDNLLPAAEQVPAANRIHLGQVRTHHWGVAYRTFNQGKNRFPRRAFYRALIKTISTALQEQA